jgi:short-subunit dehydrogenase
LKKTKGDWWGFAANAGYFHQPQQMAMDPSKHAMVGFFDSLRIELAGSGVSVTMIFPEWVSTGITSRALKTDGTPTGEISLHERNVMTVETCARVIIRAAETRKREVVMTLLGKLELWFKLIVPGVVDQIVRKKTE